jgi:hypothetical protein
MFIFRAFNESIFHLNLFCRIGGRGRAEKIVRTIVIIKLYISHELMKTQVNTDENFRNLNSRQLRLTALFRLT